MPWEARPRREDTTTGRGWRLMVLGTATLAIATSGLAQVGFGGPAAFVVASRPPAVADPAPSQFLATAVTLPVAVISWTRARFSSGRDKVAVDLYTPTGHGPFPVVILLHGARPRGEEPYYNSMASDLAAHGFLAMRVHYYDRGRKGRGTRTQWVASVSDALTFAASLPDADADRNAVVGFSLGAFLALAAAPADPRIGAVVAYYGGISPGQAGVAQIGMPPVLLFHGTADRIVPVRRSLDAATLLHAVDRAADVVVYPGVRHGFCLNSRGGADRAAAADSWERTLSFLACHLACPPADASPAARLVAAGPLADPSEGELAATTPTPWTVPPANARIPVLINPDPTEVRSAAATGHRHPRRAHATPRVRAQAAARTTRTTSGG